MTLRAFFAGTTLAFLIGCGGGGGTGNSASEPVMEPLQQPDPVVLRTFDNGSGVARAEGSVEGLKFVSHVMTGDIANYRLGDSTSVADVSGLDFVGSNQYGSFYAGPVTVNGTAVNAVGYIDDTEQTLILYGYAGDRDILSVFGEKSTNIPVSGTFTYNGTNVIGTRDGLYSEDGTFAMRVDFARGQASITGSTDSTTIGASGILINPETGDFNITNLSITDTVNNTTVDGTLYGSLHGAGATGVTGIYHDNASNPLIAGAIAGTR